MTPFYDLNQIASMEEDDDDHSPSLPYPIFFNTSQVFPGPNIPDTNLPFKQQLHHDELIDPMMIQGSSNCIANHEIAEQRSSSAVDQQHQSGKWMSSKMRIMKKMMSPRDQAAVRKPRRSRQLLLQDQQQVQKESIQASGNNDNSTSDGVVRVCSDCNTTKTPLWRSGPSGPKSLCNACGIRQRKARRALAAAAAASVGLIPTVTENEVRKSDNDRTVPFKKRCRFSAASQKKICNFDDIVIRLSKSSAFHRVFPQDEKDAAILLMALSCGLACS